MRIHFYTCCILLLITPCALADQFCFALAQTVYEQIYCELQVKAQTKGLPAFDQFKKNSEQVQASLLKRPAGRNGIKLPLPKKPIARVPVELVMQAPTKVISKPTANPAIVSQSTRTEPNSPPARIANQANVNSKGCNLVKQQIQCGTDIYQLQGNKNNRRLAAHVLDDAHKMNLPTYEQGQGMGEYLSKAYEQYIDKMCAIGLGGVTMTYGKFSFLYQDIQTKGLDFVQRFELMYKFLKKDKATMGISEAIQAPAALGMSDCQMLTQTRFVCAYQGRNYIYDQIAIQK